MKINLETNVRGYVSDRKSEFKILAVELLLVALFVGSSLFYAQYQPLIRDFIVANVAHSKAGLPVPFDDAVYLRGMRTDPDDAVGYGIESNNLWMLDQTRLIVPYFYYEKVSAQGLYPAAVGSTPMYNDESFHIAGRMISDPTGYIALLNERLFIDNRWNDQRKALEVLVHELVHVQGGNYLYGTSEELESATSIATVETLAAMCNYSHEIACEAFWLEVESLARSSLLVGLQDIGYGHLYERWAKLFWRTPQEQIEYDKSIRRWSDDPETLYIIRTKYQLIPWDTILENVPVSGRANTGFRVCDDFACRVLGMPFDDIAYLFQPFSWLLEW